MQKVKKDLYLQNYKQAKNLTYQNQEESFQSQESEDEEYDEEDLRDEDQDEQDNNLNFAAVVENPSKRAQSQVNTSRSIGDTSHEVEAVASGKKKKTVLGQISSAFKKKFF